MCLLRYDYFSASRNGCTALRRIFGGFSNEKGPIFHYLYKDNKIIPRRLEGRYKSFQHFFDRQPITLSFLYVFGTCCHVLRTRFPAFVRPWPGPGITSVHRPRSASGQGHICAPQQDTGRGQIPASFPRSAPSPCGYKEQLPGCWCSARSAPGARAR